MAAKHQRLIELFLRPRKFFEAWNEVARRWFEISTEQ